MQNSHQLKNNISILTYYLLWTILCINAELPDDSTLIIDFPCGPHPIDMFLSKLFDYLEKQETPFIESNENDEKLHIKMTYAKLLYAFTPMPKSSYYVYNEIMRSINSWNDCISKQPRLKKWSKRRHFLQNVNPILLSKSTTTE
ncbi:hypothetical protein EWB00_000285 [Schistosoma japonicum]|uniref:SJCHGC05512 protein n=1 Tax=Schistosoma japonicum TaxID=6182 RepID=Q5DF71_SCHJA|nr:SJCHGC05512 protein [Schistosoma japonicum]TNN16643.1 hypothetical protein EWB00_000285 [Schistosoma japonicum]CAX73574.1 hypothetical protein [Schistosoma japonicum]